MSIPYSQAGRNSHLLNNSIDMSVRHAQTDTNYLLSSAMKLSGSTTRCTRSCVFFCCVTLVVSLFAYGQSSDDVHVVPRQAPDHGSVGDTVSAAPLPPSNLRRNAFHVSVDLVLVPVDVNDAMNRPVLSLKKEDFSLFDDGKQQPISYFSHEDAPTSVAILFDVSKSMTNKIESERAALVEFFKNANPEDEYFGIAFSNRPRVLTDPDRSIEEIEQKLTDVTPRGATAMLDAVYLAISELRRARYERKAIVIISDGGDNASRYTLKQIKTLVEESDVQIYAVGLFETFFFNTFEEKMGKRWLSEITDATGGRTITVDDRGKLANATAEISRAIRSQYVLGYRAPHGASRRWRKIKVKVLASAYHYPLKTHYKTGYITAE
jgi:Ca-activated chloride channel homolog